MQWMQTFQWLNGMNVNILLVNAINVNILMFKCNQCKHCDG